MAPPGGPYSGYPTFAAPAHIVTAIKAVGYDACTTASNHSLDQGFSGITRTLEVLDAQWVRHTGTARSSWEDTRPLLITRQGVTIGIVSATYGTNGIPVPSTRPYAVNTPLSATTILRDARRAREAGADIVIVAIHAGTEYQHSPNAQQKSLVTTLTASRDVSLVYGHHAHVVQPITKVNYKWVAYGLGNSFATSTTQYNASTGEQIMARFRFYRRWDGNWVVKQASYIPGYSPNVRPYRWVDLVTASKDTSLSSTTRDAYSRRVSHVRSVVNLLGGHSKGLTMAGPLPTS
ncbi:CapA family protein [Janibacter sp. G56]|uniref:CapA family protein n=1 Tax=Janibacter sp. G56 TaxID=3418717 RepID=UPI003D031294